MVTCQCSECLCVCNEKADLHKRPFKRSTRKCQSKTHHSQIGLHERNDDYVCMPWQSNYTNSILPFLFARIECNFRILFGSVLLCHPNAHAHSHPTISVRLRYISSGYLSVLFHFTSAFCYKINLRRWCVRLTIGSFSCF